MRYFRRARTRILFGTFALFALVLLSFPSIDLAVSGVFFNGQAFPAYAWHKVLQRALAPFLILSIVVVALVYAFNRARGRNVGNINGRRVVYLLLVAIVGAGLIVNLGFKDHIGRARPRNVMEFGGSQLFTPPFVVSQECRTNCSFSSGDVACAFFSIALVRALTRRRRYWAAALAFGAFVAFARVSAGAHFFSDTIVSFFVMLIVADGCWYYVVRPGERPEAEPVGGSFGVAIDPPEAAAQVQTHRAVPREPTVA